MSRKGIILAGGLGTRLYPITEVISKQLLPIYDKPMIYYPLATLMMADIREILIISTSRDRGNFKKLLGDGSNLGISIEYRTQDIPDGLAQAFLIGESFIKESQSALILGDNLFHGNDEMVAKVSASNEKGAHIFAYPVHDPERYGVVSFNKDGKVIEIKEKPSHPKTKFAVTGLYFYDNSVVERAKTIVPSKRGELEITDLNNLYLKENLLTVELMGKSMAWLDAGTVDSLHEASSYIKTLEQRQGQKIGLPEEVAWKKGWINSDQLVKIADPLKKSGYGKYLINLLGN